MAVSTTTRPNLRIVALVGLAAGALGGLFGVGGGLIIVPGLVLVAQLERRLAHGTSLAATLPIALASLSTYVVNGNVDWAIAPLMAIGTVTGAIVGTKLLTILPKRTITILFIVTVLATAVRLFLATETTGRDNLTAWSAVLLVLIGLATGTLSGLLGIGGGIVMVPAMVVLFGMVPLIAKGTSVAVIVPTSIVGTLRNRANANVDLKVAAVAGGCGVLSAIAGGIIADDISTGVSNMMFGVLLIFVAGTQFLTLRSDRDEAAVD
ncbi:sulfite exporter TauE/SafE family protein [uncultured Ilumatobacter sp.]|uniref:sulfite exporter TauE/SafE family protein n=1 Tax=uncultured Ilumatobacter sp. TaxID=879968 RepID=UPI00374F68E7